LLVIEMLLELLSTTLENTIADACDGDTSACAADVHLTTKLSLARIGSLLDSTSDS